MNQNGFAQILFISLLPLLVSIFMLTFIGANYIQLKTRTETVCLTEQMKAQKTAASLLNILLELNPIVNALKILDQGGVIAQLTAAIINPLWIPLITQLKKIVHTARELIDKYQKTSIIAAAANIYKTSYIDINNQQVQIINEHFRIFEFWLKATSTILLATQYKLAVKPDSKDLAPQYSIVRSEVKYMTIRNAWKIELEPLEIFKSFLKGSHTVTHVCAVELVERNERWRPQIVKDSLLPSFL